ncbi:MAG: hypothetical protein AB1705_01335 [Verrucomicrobiota bacterium]
MMINEYQRQTAFLRECIHFEDSEECHQLEERMTQAQRNERCLRRAMVLMAWLTMLAAAGLGYAAVLQGDLLHGVSRLTQLVLRVLCPLGVGSLVCLLVFTGVWASYRRELNRLREECRRQVMKLLETRFEEHKGAQH